MVARRIAAAPAFAEKLYYRGLCTMLKIGGHTPGTLGYNTVLGIARLQAQFGENLMNGFIRGARWTATAGGKITALMRRLPLPGSLKNFVNKVDFYRYLVSQHGLDIHTPSVWKALEGEAKFLEEGLTGFAKPVSSHARDLIAQGLASEVEETRFLAQRLDDMLQTGNWQAAQSFARRALERAGTFEEALQTMPFDLLPENTTMLQLETLMGDAWEGLAAARTVGGVTELRGLFAGSNVARLRELIIRYHTLEGVIKGDIAMADIVKADAKVDLGHEVVGGKLTKKISTFGQARTSHDIAKGVGPLADARDLDFGLYYFTETMGVGEGAELILGQVAAKRGFGPLQGDIEGGYVAKHPHPDKPPFSEAGELQILPYGEQKLIWRTSERFRQGGQGSLYDLLNRSFASPGSQGFAPAYTQGISQQYLHSEEIAAVAASPIEPSSASATAPIDASVEVGVDALPTQPSTSDAPADSLAAFAARSVAVAMELWQRAPGVPAAPVITVEVSDLPSGQLAFATITALAANGLPARGALVIDTDANGRGWFLDPTLLDSEESGAAVGGEARRADSGPAAGHYDLLSAVAHEVGHLLGFTSVYAGFAAHVTTDAAGTPVFVDSGLRAPLSDDRDHLRRGAFCDDLMGTVLGVGIRRLPSPVDRAILAAAWDEGNRPAGNPAAPLDLEHHAALGSSTLGFVLLDEAVAGDVAAGLTAGVVNGDFAVSDPAAGGFGWNAIGGAAISDGEGVLQKGDRLFSDLSQTFVLPATAKMLRFTITEIALEGNLLNPPDAFEMTLLRTDDGTPLVATAAGLAGTDALLNIQPGGTTFFGPQVTLVGLEGVQSGDAIALDSPLDVAVTLPELGAETPVTLLFDLISFGNAASRVTLDNVNVLGTLPPPVEFHLDRASDSGVAGDNVTSFSTITVTGTTDPSQVVLLDTDGDGFDDGTVTAGDDGRFGFPDLPLAEGPNTIRVQATNEAGPTEVSLAVTLDAQTPSGSLVQPAPDTTASEDLGYVDVQWADAGMAGLDESSFSTDDITLPGVTVNDFQKQTNGVVRYFYTPALADGTVTVTMVGGQVADLAGNTNPSQQATFTLSTHAPSGELVAPQPGVLTAKNLGYVEIQWTDGTPAELNQDSFDVRDVTVSGVTITAFANQGDGRVRYFYTPALADGSVTVTLVAGEVAGRSGKTNPEAQFSFTLDAHAPTGVLVAPAPDAPTAQDLGYVEIQWTDAGPSGLDENTFGAADLTVTGVSIDRIENLGGGRVRYVYNADGQSVADGSIAVTIVAGQVADQAGNTNAAGQATFTLDRQPPHGVLVAPAPGSLAAQDLEYVEIQWTDAGPAGLHETTFDTADVTVSGVTIDRIESRGGGVVRYFYSPTPADGDVTVALAGGQVADRAGNTNVAQEFLFQLDAHGPQAHLVSPAPGEVLQFDPGYVELRWTDVGPAGVDAASFGIQDIWVSGVTIDRVENRGEGVVRYWYGEDGDEVPGGTVAVVQRAGEVLDLLGNGNDPATNSFVLESNGSISGFVYADVDNDGCRDPQERGLPNVTVTLLGPRVTKGATVVTAADGSYHFTGLRAGTYSVSETQPTAFNDGQENTQKSGPGRVAGDCYTGIQMTGHTEATEYNFGERGLRADYVTLQFYFSSTPDGAQLVQNLDLAHGVRWFAFRPASDSVVTVAASGMNSDLALEVYTAAFLPVALSTGELALSAPVAAGEQYLVHVAGTASAAAQAVVRIAPETATSAATEVGNYWNPANPCDVNQDGHVTPLDVLLVINAINATGARHLSGINPEPYRVDVSGDQRLSALDALLVINYLNAPRGAEGEAIAESADEFDTLLTDLATNAARRARAPETHDEALGAVLRDLEF
jgi:uncharacterized protein YbdZ (MbtH family)